MNIINFYFGYVTDKYDNVKNGCKHTANDLKSFGFNKLDLHPIPVS